MSHHFSCYTALPLLVSKCFYHVSCHALKACSMWSRGSWAGGIPGFRIVLYCFTHTTVWQCDFCVSVFRFVCFTIPILELIQYYHLFLIDSHWTGPPITFLSVFLVLVFCLVVFLCVLLLCVFSCCWLCFCLESWWLLDYVQVPYQFTLVPPTNGGYLYASIS